MTSDAYEKIFDIKLKNIKPKGIDIIEPKEACTCSTKLVIERRIKEFR